MRCTTCGAENLPGLRFCEQCAAPLAATPASPETAPASQPMQICPSCDAENLPELRFCEQCATPLAAASPAAPEAASEKAPAPAPALHPPQRAVRVCPACGAENVPGLRFCEQCATPLGVQAPASAPVRPAVPRPPAPARIAPPVRRRRRWPLALGASWPSSPASCSCHRPPWPRSGR